MNFNEYILMMGAFLLLIGGKTIVTGLLLQQNTIKLVLIRFINQLITNKPTIDLITSIFIRLISSY